MDPKLTNERMCSPYSISVRGEEAKYNREVVEHQKKQRELERTFRHNERKLKVTQRGVMSLLGRTPWHPDNILFSHNQPGFCYRRNGTPRRFSSLAESETRNILDDLEGNLGFLEEPASNIVSDNPMLTEVLSSPEIVSILCNLRSTAAIMKNPQLFKQFVRNIQKSSPRPLRFKEDTPYEFLRQYRTDLINQFFEALQVHAEIRLSNALRGELGNNLLPGGTSGLSSLDDRGNVRESLADIEEFTTALKAGLLEAQAEHFHPKYVNTDTTPAETDSPDPVIKQQLLQLGLRKVESFKGLSPSVYGFHESRSPQRSSIKISPSATSLPIPPANSSEATPTNSKGATRNPARPGNVNPSHHNAAASSRNEFATFVKTLINEVENLDEAGKTLRTIRGKNAYKNIGESTTPLIKVLRKKSLFSSLTEDDLLFYEYEQGKKEAEKSMAKELHIRPTQGYSMAGGFTVHVPTRTDSLATATTDYIRQGSPIESESPRQSTAASYEATCELLNQEYSPCYKSVARVCCRACKAKVRHACNAARERDVKDKKVVPHWKAGRPGDWSNHFSASVSQKKVGIKGVPDLSRKSYLYESDVSSPFSTRPASSLKTLGSGKESGLKGGNFPGAPTPVRARNKYFSSLNQGSPPEGGAAGSEHFSTNKSDTFSNRTGENTRTSTAKSNGRGNSWTLKVSRLDILKLRHELDIEHIRGDLESFEKKVMRSKLSSGLEG